MRALFKSLHMNNNMVILKFEAKLKNKIMLQKKLHSGKIKSL